MSAIQTTQSTLDLSASSDLLDAMANESRLTILNILTQGEKSVGTLCEMIGMGQSALSQHLAKLRAAKLVTTRRDAQTIYYSRSSEPVQRVLALLSAMFEEEKGEFKRSA